MAGRPPKPVHLHLAEGNRRHLTKKEIEVRKKAEQALLSGSSFKEWADVKNTPMAHKEFVRLRKVFRAIGKDDALHENSINRYCMLHAECKQFENYKDKIIEDVHELEKKGFDMEFTEYMRNKVELHKQLMACDKKIMEKRKMMLDIEKENIMTIASALRSIPKKPVEKDEEDPMAVFLRG